MLGCWVTLGAIEACTSEVVLSHVIHVYDSSLCIKEHSGFAVWRQSTYAGYVLHGHWFVLSTTGNDMGVVIGHRSPGP